MPSQSRKDKHTDFRFHYREWANTVQAGGGVFFDVNFRTKRRTQTMPTYRDTPTIAIPQFAGTAKFNGRNGAARRSSHYSEMTNLRFSERCNSISGTCLSHVVIELTFPTIFHPLRGPQIVTFNFLLCSHIVVDPPRIHQIRPPQFSTASRKRQIRFGLPISEGQRWGLYCVRLNADRGAGTAGSPAPGWRCSRKAGLRRSGRRCVRARRG